MIVSSAPLRVSFAGGGSDYKSYYEKHGGSVFGSAIDKRVYIFINNLSHISDENIRFTYRYTESVQKIQEIKHPVVREALKYFDVSGRINIATMADLPGKSGLGSSSAFTVALVGGLSRFINRDLSQSEIVNISYMIEREVLKEPGGIQDHLHAVYGGMRLYKLSENGVIVSDSFLNPALEKISQLNFLLKKIGNQRESRVSAARTQMYGESGDISIAQTAHQAILLSQNLKEAGSDASALALFSTALNESWKSKKVFQNSFTSEADREIKDLLTSGALGAKICGAGESGFILVSGAEPYIQKIRTSLDESKYVNLKFSHEGLVVSKL